MTAALILTGAIAPDKSLAKRQIVDFNEGVGLVNVGGFAFYPRRIYLTIEIANSSLVEGSYSIFCLRKRPRHRVKIDGDDFAFLGPGLFRLGVPVPLKRSRHCRVFGWVAGQAEQPEPELLVTIYSTSAKRR